MEEFLPHMEEEENTFLPLLCKYFEYEELKELKVRDALKGVFHFVAPSQNLVIMSQ